MKSILKPILLAAVFFPLHFGMFALAQQPEPPLAPVPPTPPSDHIGSGRGIGQGIGKEPGQKMVYQHIVTSGGPGGELRMGPPGIWWKNPEIVQKLTITPDQQKRMDDIFQQSRLQLIDLKAAVEKQEVTLEPMLDANPPDTNKILAQIDRAAQARAELEKANAKMLLGIRTVLTPDQWTKLQSEERGNRRIIMKRKGMPEGLGGPGFHFAPGVPEAMIDPPFPDTHIEIREFNSGPQNDIDF